MQQRGKGSRDLQAILPDHYYRDEALLAAATIGRNRELQAQR